MITLKVTLLLAFDARKSEVFNVKTPRKSKRKAGKKDTSSKKSSKSSKSSKSKKPKTTKEKSRDATEDNQIYNIIEVEKPLIYISLDYNLVKDVKYKVDVICWGPVAKIYSANGVHCIKTMINGDIVWIPVFIEHYLSQLSSTEEVQTFLEHNISFTIKTGKNTVGMQAKNDKTTIFYEWKHDKNTNTFEEIFVQKPMSEDNETVRQEVKKTLQQLLIFSSKNEIITWIYNQDKAHLCRVLNIISKRDSGKIVFCKQPEELEVKIAKNKKKKKREKKSVKSEESTSFAYGCRIPSHIFMTDSRLATYQLSKTNSEIVDGYLIMSSSNILTLGQKYQLQPFILKIRKIVNFPCERAKKEGFKGIYVKCDNPDIIKFDTKIRPITDVISFQESHFVYACNLAHVKLLEMLQTQRLFIQIMGVKEITEKKLAPSTGQKKNKTKKKGKKEKKKPETSDDSALLAIAYLDLNPLYKKFSRLREYTQCHNFKTIFLKRDGDLARIFFDVFTVNELNLNIPPYILHHSPLSEESLITNNTMLKFEAFFLFPQYPSFLLKDIVTYKRLLLIISDEEAAKLIFNSVLIYNHEQLVGLGPVLIPSLCTKTTNYPFFRNNNEREESLLSGFIIDDVNSYIVFIEGPSNGYILSLLHQVNTYNYSVAKVFYNSEYLFEERLYANFFKYNGFLLVNLKMPLVDIFQAAKIYLTGNVPLFCFKAIQKLHLLLQSTTFKSILNNNLLPTEIELTAFSVEFGLQVGFKNESFAVKSRGDLFSKTDLFRFH